MCDVYCASATNWYKWNVVAADLSFSFTFLRGRAALEEKQSYWLNQKKPRIFSL